MCSTFVAPSANVTCHLCIHGLAFEFMGRVNWVIYNTFNDCTLSFEKMIFCVWCYCFGSIGSTQDWKGSLLELFDGRENPLGGYICLVVLAAVVDCGHSLMSMNWLGLSFHHNHLSSFKWRAEDHHTLVNIRIPSHYAAFPSSVFFISEDHGSNFVKCGSGQMRSFDPHFGVRVW